MYICRSVGRFTCVWMCVSLSICVSASRRACSYVCTGRSCVGRRTSLKFGEVDKGPGPVFSLSSQDYSQETNLGRDYLRRRRFLRECSGPGSPSVDMSKFCYLGSRSPTYITMCPPSLLLTPTWTSRNRVDRKLSVHDYPILSQGFIVERLRKGLYD